MKRSAIVSAPVLVVALLLFGTGARAALTERQMVILRSQPAVFKVVTYGLLELKTPDHVTVRLELLKAEYAEAESKGIIPAEISAPDYYWAKIIANPFEYLEASGEIALWRSKSNTGAPFAEGSAFAVSREGILLTNAHVVNDAGDGLLLGSDEAAAYTLRDPIADGIDQLSKQIGTAPTGDTRDDLKLSLARWLRTKSHAHANFTEAKIVINYAAPSRAISQLALQGAGLSTLFSVQPKPITLDTRVLAKGVPYPGKDVAVLQVVPGADFNPQDRLICLPLGDSDRVLPGDAIEAMGFPGVAFDPETMARSAAFRVATRPGQISQSKEMKGGWEGFEMTANINHGDSGGPVVYSDGTVIGINVAGENAQAVGFNVAVPINLAKELLKQAGITPDPGPLTGQWVHALQLFSDRRWADAEHEFDAIANAQAGSGTMPSVFQYSNPLSEYVNPYVREMQGRCRLRLK